MPVFGVQTTDEQAKNYLRIYAERMSEPLVQTILDGKVKQYDQDLFVVSVEPRLPPLHLLGLGLLVMAMLFEWSTLWVWIPGLLLLSWVVFWTPQLYYWLLQVGRWRQTKYTGGTKYLGGKAVVWRMMQ